MKYTPLHYYKVKIEKCGINFSILKFINFFKKKIEMDFENHDFPPPQDKSKKKYH